MPARSELGRNRLSDKPEERANGLGLMGRFISLNAAIATVAVLYWCGTLAIYERNVCLQTANLTSAASSYQDILVQGFEVVFVQMLVFPILMVGGIGFALALLCCVKDVPGGTSRQRFWVLIFLSLVTGVFGLIAASALIKVEQPLVLLRPDVGGTVVFFKEWFSWALLLPSTIVYSVWLYVEERTVRRKRWVLWVGVLWLIFQLDIFARGCGVLSLQNFGIPEIQIQERRPASLDKSRVFLLGETAANYTLLTIKDAGAQRAIVVVRNDQLPMFNIVGRVDVFHNFNPVRSVGSKPGKAQGG